MSETNKIDQIAQGNILDSEDSENDDDVPDEFEDDGFLVQDEEEEESYEEESSSRKRRRRHHDDARPRKKSRKLKKLKSKMSHDDEDYEDQYHGGETFGREESGNTSGVRYHGYGEEGVELDEEGNDFFGGDDYTSSGRGGRRSQIREPRGQGELDGFIENDMYGDYADEEEEEDYEYDVEDIYSEPASLRQHYEPDVLQEKFFTEFDDQVRATDVPERLQVELEDVAEVDVDAMDLKEEARWVVAQDELNEVDMGSGWGDANDGNGEGENEEEQGLQGSVHNVLELITKERMDLPSIFHYRPDSIPAISSFQSLATILDLHHRYLQLMKRKHTLLQSLSELDTPSLYRNLLEEAQSFEELDDFSAYISHLRDALSQSNEDNQQQHNMERPKPRRRAGKGQYRRAMAAGLGDLAKKLGLSSQQYADNLISMFRRVPIDDPAESPEVLAEEYFKKPFDSTAKVLQGAKQILAKDIAMEPAVRRKLRMAYQHNSQIVITAGLKMRSSTGGVELHPDGIQVTEIDPQQVMQAVQAERRGMVRLNVSLDQDVVSQALDADALFLSERVSAVAKEWNAVRKSVIEQAAKELQPVMQKHVLQSLLSKARRSLAQSCAQSLRDIAFAGPFIPRDDDDDNNNTTNKNSSGNDDGGFGFGGDDWGDIGGGDASGNGDGHGSNGATDDEETLRQKVGKGYRVVGVSEATDGKGVYFAAVNENGDLDDRLEWRVLPAGPRTQLATPQVREQTNAFKELICSFQPHAIALVGLSVGTRRLHQELEGAIESTRQEAGTPPSVQRLKVHWVPDNLSRVYAMSDRGQRELPQVNPGMRMALGVARRLQHPLSETAGLFNSQQDILNLNLHPLQSMLPSSHLQRTLEWEMVDMVCAVGVDINHVVNHQHAMGMLQFISGLGPRKSAQIRSMITGLGSQGHVRSRVELGKLLNSPRIAENCLGFIRVLPFQEDNDNIIFDPLDNTRIHPKHYPVAETICKELAPSAPQGEHVEEVLLRGNNQDLDQVDLNALAGMLTEEGVGHKVLKQIAEELRHPFRDPRPLFQDPDSETLWTMLTGETDRTLHPGKMVEVTVIKTNDRQVLVRLPCGVVGSIMPSQMPSWVENVEDVSPGTMLEAVVKEIDKEGFFVHLSAQDMDVDAARPTPTPTPTDGAGMGATDGKKPVPSLQQKRRKAKKQRYRRNVNHPLFSNVDYAGAVRKLQNSQVGEAVIRPSSKGPDHLAITFKFFGDCFMTIDVKEHEKSNPLALGRVLEVNGHKFHELDEVCVRYVDAKVQNAEKVMRSDKYMEGSSEEVETYLKDLKRREPGRIHYRIGLYHNHPGLFMIYYISSSRVHHEVFSVVPEGFRYHSKTYSSVLSLINAFKRYIQSGRPRHRSRSAAHNQSSQQQQQRQQQQTSDPQQQTAWGSLGTTSTSEWEDSTTSTGPGWGNIGGGGDSTGGWGQLGTAGTSADGRRNTAGTGTVNQGQGSSGGWGDLGTGSNNNVDGGDGDAWGVGGGGGGGGGWDAAAPVQPTSNNTNNTNNGGWDDIGSGGDGWSTTHNSSNNTKNNTDGWGLASSGNDGW